MVQLSLILAQKLYVDPIVIPAYLPTDFSLAWWLQLD